MQAFLKKTFRYIERLGLLVILAAIVYAIGEKGLTLWDTKTVEVTDILLLFMYLELITMVRLYWSEGRISVLLPIFIAIIGIARHMMADSQEFDQYQLVGAAIAVTLLSISVLIIAYCQERFPYHSSKIDPNKPDDGNQ